jgi:hypothetical protein
MEVDMLKTLGAIIVASALSSVAVAAQPKPLTNSELDEVVAGWYDCCTCPPPPETVKGNNGWGNGADPSNPGSDNGGTAASKTANASIPGGGINQNPTTSSGR